MNWDRVAKYLDDEGFALRQRAETTTDPQAQQEMRTRGAIFITFAEALRRGFDVESET